MKRSLLFTSAVVTFVIAAAVFAQDTKTEKKPDVLAGSIDGLAVTNMLTSQLELTEGVEVVVTHLVIPPHTELPIHWHHGEEFAYILEGSAILWQEGKEEVQLNKGDVAKVPLKQVHTAKTTDSSATILVFRVHESGQPVRVLVN